MPTYERLDYGSADGSQWGGAATDKLGCYGATPVVQPSTISGVTTAEITSVTTTAATSTTNAWGYSTSTQADAIVTAVNALIVRAGVLTTQGNAATAALISLGLIAAS